jgi:hypothetical protein
MKKLITIILAVISMNLTAQINRSSDKATLDTLVASKIRATTEISAPIFKMGVDTPATKAELRNNQVLVSGPTFKAVGNTPVPYANKGETPGNEAFYYDGQGIRLDTGLFISNNGEETSAAITGMSTNNIGLCGLSTNLYGGYLWSINGIGAYIVSNYGKTALHVYGGQRYNAIFTDAYRDSILFYSGAKIQIKTKLGVKFEVDTLGKISQKSGSDSIISSPTNGIIYSKGGASVFSVNSQGIIKSKVIHLVASKDSIVGYTFGGTANVYYKINPGALNVKPDSTGISIAGDSIRPRYSGDYMLTISHAISSGTASDQIRTRVKKNNAWFSPTLSRWTTVSNASTTVIPNTEHTWYLYGITAGDWISFWSTNTTGSRIMHLTDFSIIITRVPE